MVVSRIVSAIHKLEMSKSPTENELVSFVLSYVMSYRTLKNNAMSVQSKSKKIILKNNLFSLT